MCGPHSLLTRSLRLHHWPHLPAKTLLPPGRQGGGIPRGPCEKATESTEDTSLSNAAFNSSEKIVHEVQLDSLEKRRERRADSTDILKEKVQLERQTTAKGTAGIRGARQS
jgi:hypothetical protein